LRKARALSTPIKDFKPDAAVPEARTLIEYKYISSAAQVPKRVDDMFADLAGYRGREWDHIVYVIYETRRFIPEEKWHAQLKGLKGTHAIVVKGIPANAAAYRRRSLATIRRPVVKGMNTMRSKSRT
jgi:hypothetical protein